MVPFSSPSCVQKGWKRSRDLPIAHAQPCGWHPDDAPVASFPVCAISIPGVPLAGLAGLLGEQDCHAWQLLDGFSMLQRLLLAQGGHPELLGRKREDKAAVHAVESPGEGSAI